MTNLLLSPPIAFILICGFLTVVYIIIQRHAVSGPDHPDKHLPYSGGQKIPPLEARLSYEKFFRIALLFGIAHVAVLVLATLPLDRSAILIGLFFLFGISISAFALGRFNTRS
ncbi:MAG: hypothetical protein ACOCYU_03585 [Brevefilum sp.]